MKFLFLILGILFIPIFFVFFYSFTELLVFSLMYLLVFLVSTQPEMVSMGMIFDKMSIGMVALSLIVGVMTISCSPQGKMSMVLLFSMILANFFFTTDSYLLFFVFFEFSLVPLLIIILGWGAQAERLKATQFMMMFTLVSSFPLFVVVILLISKGEVLSLEPFSEMSSTIMMLSFMAFLVKMPMFFLHSWLPKAHVEAPLEGSMVLAGVMLKVGSYGLIRMYMSSSISYEFSLILFSIGLMGSILSLLYAISSDDMKMSVAFSSISHMNLVLSSIFSGKTLGFDSAVIIMVTHGICSPLLFFFVTNIYSMSSSRSVLLSKGLVSKFPFFWGMGGILWFMNLSVPPFFSFVGELCSFMSLISFSFSSMIFVTLFMLISSFYSVMNLGFQGHSSNKLCLKTYLKNYAFSLFFLISFLLNLIMFFFHFGIL